MLQREALRRRTALLVLLAFFLSLCAPAPAAAFFFGGVGIKDEKEMGRKFDAMLRATLSVVEDPEVSLYVNKVVARLTAPMPPQPYTFKAAVILHNSLNAFAVPGGYVYVFTGLLMNLDREDELAGVLAHELAHVTQRHVASRLERAQYLTLGSLLLAIAGVAAGGPGALLWMMVAALFGMATMWMAVFADMGASLLVLMNGLRVLRK